MLLLATLFGIFVFSAAVAWPPGRIVAEEADAASPGAVGEVPPLPDAAAMAVSDDRPAPDDGTATGDPPDGAPVIAGFDPALEAIEIVYEGETPPQLSFARAGGATDVLADGIVVAQMSGVSSLDLRHVRVIAA